MNSKHEFTALRFPYRGHICGAEKYVVFSCCARKRGVLPQMLHIFVFCYRRINLMLKTESFERIDKIFCVSFNTGSMLMR